jgi:photosystem II stability/assembly factor-like uncharacterized protein
MGYLKRISEKKILFLVFMTIVVNAEMSLSQQWVSIGPPGGRVKALSVSPSSPNTIFAATEENVLFVSRDGGRTSDVIRDSNGFLYFGSTKLFFSPQSADTIYTSHYRTTDGGETWHPMSLYGSDYAINSLDSKRLFATSYGERQLRVSNDAGETWTSLYTFENSLDAIAISSSDTSILYAATDDAVFSSSNSGVTWKSVNLVIPNVKKIVVNPKNSQEVFALAGSVYKTIDGGQTWNQIFSPIALSPINDLVLNSMDTEIIYIVTGDHLKPCIGHVHKSTNGGASWRTVDTGLPTDYNRFIYQISINQKNPEELFVGTYGFGVFKTTDGGTDWNWTKTTKPFILSISFDETKEGHVYVGTVDEGIVKSTDGGGHWTLLDFDSSSTISSGFRQIVFHRQDQNIAYIAAGVYGLLKSIDGGISWCETTLKGGNDPWSLVWSIAINPETPETIFAGKSGYWSRDLYRSTDGGGTWDNLLIANNVGSIEKILIEKRFPKIVYVCAGDQGFFKSTDNGNTWQKLNNGLKVTDPPLVAQVMSLTIGESSDELYLAQWIGGVNKSTNGGNSWYAIDTILKPLGNAIDIISSTSSPEYLLVAQQERGQLHTPSYSSGGVSVGSKDGTKWKNIFRGSAQVLKFDPLNNEKLFVGTKAGIFLTADSISLSIKARYEQRPSTIFLSQNYPNPFNMSTVIRFYLTDNERVSLKIYNMLGQEISALISDQTKSSGWHSVAWNGVDNAGRYVSTGIYIYKLIVNNQVFSRKLLIMK